MRSTLRRSPLIALSVLAMVGIAPAATVQATTPPDDTPPTDGDAQVIAQGIIEFGDEEYGWERETVDVDAAGMVLELERPAFFVGGSGPVVATGTGTSTVLLDGGEATFQPGPASISLTPVGAVAVNLDQIAVNPAAAESSDRFLPGAGLHEVELWGDLLVAGERLVVASDLPAFVVVSSGSVTDADGLTIGAGAAAALTGDIELTNTADSNATVVVAVIGPTLDLELAPSAGSSTTTSTAPDDTPPPGPGATQPPSQTTAPSNDRDGDGLTNTEEADLGTDPDDADTDDDDLTDGDEIEFGTAISDPDSDGDMLTDGFELHEANTDPLNYDTDGDSLSDGDELNEYGTSPLSWDHDGDSIDDGSEVNSFGTDPLKFDTDGDGTSDGDEIVVSQTDPLDPASHP